MSPKQKAVGYLLLFVLGLLAPLMVYPVFMMKLLCFALFACAFNLLIGYTGLLSFGHAAFLGGAGYVAGYAMRDWGLTPELGILAGTAFAAVAARLRALVTGRAVAAEGGVRHAATA